MKKLFRRWIYKRMLHYFEKNKGKFHVRKYPGICSYLAYTFPYYHTWWYKEIWNYRPESKFPYWFGNDDNDRIKFIKETIKRTY